MSRAVLLFRSFFMPIALVVAIAFTGFAHKAAYPALSPDLVAFLEMGGSLADICGGPGEQHPTGDQTCEACRLVGAALIPENCTGPAVALSVQARVLALVSDSIRNAQPLDPARLTRAPPQA